ncbi:hypothetical protein NOVOSPHI9U_260034 [Novosphingobium sp. 9U]|nr:hypothetical protein NOVOSPHI9U_260034 [Novosphingobium sp. 9U]
MLCCVAEAKLEGGTLSSISIAAHWGRKAAQAGLRISDNPYQGGIGRAAWRRGFRQIRAAVVERLDRGSSWKQPLLPFESQSRHGVDRCI